VAMTEAQLKARGRIREWRLDPIKFVRDCFHAEPDAWQLDALALAGAVGPKRIAMKACAGPGKTAVLAWLGWHRLLCFAAPNEHPKGVAVSITSENLSRNLWAEMARWRNESPLLLQAFEWQRERIFAKDHPETWFLSAVGWSKAADVDTIGRTLSGLHSRFPFYLIDESGDIPPNMARSAEQGLTSCEDGLIVTAGNTTSQTGLLYEVCTRGQKSDEDGKPRWSVISITGDPDDPKRSPRVKIEWAREQIALYGRDNPWVMAYVLGQFPPGSINALLSLEDVEKTMNLHPRIETYGWAQKRVGVDVARFGDDRTVLFPRQGIASFNPEVMRHARDSAVSVAIAGRVMAKKMDWMREANDQEDVLTFFDDTVGWAHGAIDVMRAAGHSPYAIAFDRPANDPRYFNMRAEMWMKMADAIKAGLSLPPMPELINELTAPTYFFNGGKFQIESKDQIKKRLGKSPDLADALALTFAIPDRPAGMTKLPGYNRSQQSSTYDPYAGM
jgi:phage terminase large subunit